MDDGFRQIIGSNGDVLLLSQRLHQAGSLRRHRPQIKLGRLKLQRLIVTAGHNQQVAHELGHLLDFIADIFHDLFQEGRFYLRVILQNFR